MGGRLVICGILISRRGRWSWFQVLGRNVLRSLGTAGLESGEEFALADALQVQVPVVVLAVKRPSSHVFTGSMIQHSNFICIKNRTTDGYLLKLSRTVHCATHATCQRMRALITICSGTKCFIIPIYSCLF